MLLRLQSYKTIVFDCDGVVLNSNQIKTNAFYEASKHFGEALANSLVNYHIQNGGISRYAKIEYFLKEVVKRPFSKHELDDLVNRFSSAVIDGLMECEVAVGLATLKEKTHGANWLIVSGGDENELREIFSARNLANYFDGGIFGSPDTKDEILAREIKLKNIKLPALFLGDSKYDSRAAKNASLDFIFMSGWTEVKDWQEYCTDNKLSNIANIHALCG